MAEDFLVLGEALIDIVGAPDRASIESVGGSPTNAAVALSRLGYGVELAAAVGRDRHGSAVVDHLDRAGVRWAVDPFVIPRTSTSVATVDRAGVATYEFDILADLPAPAASTDRLHLHTGSIGAVLEPGSRVVRAALDAHRATASISYDINARPAATGAGPALVAQVERIAARSDIVKASDEDLAIVYPELTAEVAARRLLDGGASAVIVTRGPAGATCFTELLEVDVPSVVVDVADSIAAGDSFCAGVLDGLARAGCLGDAGRPLLRDAGTELWRDVLARATRASSITVSRPGADPPTAAELEAALLGPPRTAV